MANPQYPMQPGQGPMGHPSQPNMGAPHGQQPYGQQPYGQQPRGPQVARRGTSRAVPVVVSAGLAVGVFCGLLFGLGTGSPKASASPSTGNNVKPADPADTAPTPVATVTPPKADPPKPTVAATTPPPTPGTGSGSAAPGAGSGSATTAAGTTPTITKPAEPAVVKAKLTIELKPDAIAQTAKITVDGAEIKDGATELDLGTAKKKEVKVVVKASGYKDVEQKVDIEGDTTLKIELVKRAPSGTGPGGIRRPPPPGGSGKKKPPGGGGLIDI